MRRIATAVIAALVFWGGPARATLLQSCCACVEGHTAQTSGSIGSTGTVFFCAEANAGDIPGLETRCETVSDNTGALTCEGNIPGPSCRDQLAESGIICPAAGAPAAGPAGLLTLAVALGAVGAMVLRRHRRRAPAT